MDLPKGIVVNTPGLSEDVERINAEPVASEVIAHFWKVYTTTKRTLRDPTAERLENYWWRIWGSRQRELRGATVAQLFLYISDGFTFNGRPLLSKIHRYEGHSTPRRIQNGEDVNGNTSADSSNASNTRPSSSSKRQKKPVPAAPMPHPILKKSRGPSNTGPRPTARFVSPHESEDEEEKQTSNEHVTIRPPTPDKVERESQNLLKVPQPSKKKGKGHIVASVAGRRRPTTILRRKSSQSTAEEQELRQKSKEIAQYLDQSPPDSNGQDVKKSSQTVISGEVAQRTNIACGKPPNAAIGLGVAGPGPSTHLRASENARFESQRAAVNNEDLTAEELEELELQTLLLAEANARVERSRKGRSSGGNSSSQNRRSISLSNIKSSGDGRTSAADDNGSASIVPRYAEATGELSMASADTKNMEKGKGREVKDKLQFPKRAVPSLIAKGPSVERLANSTVSKSHSQLSFLLQQNKSRTIAQNSAGKGKGKVADSESENEVLEMPKRGKKIW